MNRRRANSCPWIEGKPPRVETTKVIVCGTRDFDDYDLLASKLDRFLFWFDVVDLVLGGHGTKIERGGEWYWTGADAHADSYGSVNWLTKHFFHADWNRHGRKAGPIRNTEMAKFVAPYGYCVAFWDGESPGTQDMIRKFLIYNHEENLRVVRY